MQGPEMSSLSLLPTCQQTERSGNCFKPLIQVIKAVNEGQ